MSATDLAQEILTHVTRALPFISQNPQQMYARVDVLAVWIKKWNQENWLYIWCNESAAIDLAAQILRDAYPALTVLSIEEVNGFALWVQ